MEPTDRPTGSRAGKPRNYSGLLSEIKESIRSAQYAALKAVNKELVGLYWDIGRMIVERQAAEGWGEVRGKANVCRSAARIPLCERFFGAESLVHATVLLRVSR